MWLVAGGYRYLFHETHIARVAAGAGAAEVVVAQANWRKCHANGPLPRHRATFAGSKSWRFPMMVANVSTTNSSALSGSRIQASTPNPDGAPNSPPRSPHRRQDGTIRFRPLLRFLRVRRGVACSDRVPGRRTPSCFQRCSSCLSRQRHRSALLLRGPQHARPSRPLNGRRQSEPPKRQLRQLLAALRRRQPIGSSNAGLPHCASPPRRVRCHRRQRTRSRAGRTTR